MNTSFNEGKLNGKIEALSNSIGTVPSGKTVEGQISTLSDHIVPHSRIVKDGSNNTVCTVESYGNIRVIVFDNDSGVVPASGIYLGETFYKKANAYCYFYDGSTSVPGFCKLSTDGYIKFAKATAYSTNVQASWIVGEIIAIANDVGTD